MAAALPIVAIGLTLLGGIQQAGAATRSADAQAQASLYNAQMAQRNAAVTRQQAAADDVIARKRDKAKIATALTLYGKMGAINTQALDVLAASAFNFELDRRTALYKSELKAMGYESDAYLDATAAGSARERGDAAAGNSLFTSVGKAVPMLPGYSISTLGRTGGGTAP